jgi:hypothetical protein
VEVTLAQSDAATAAAATAAAAAADSSLSFAVAPAVLVVAVVVLTSLLTSAPAASALLLLPPFTLPLLPVLLPYAPACCSARSCAQCVTATVKARSDPSYSADVAVALATTPQRVVAEEQCEQCEDASESTNIIYTSVRASCMH